MASLPDQFHEEYDNHGDTFFEVSRLLVNNHSRHFTQSELAAKVDVSQTRISDFTTTLTDDGWTKRHENQTTFKWNSDIYNPAQRGASDAMLGLYRDLWRVIKTHIRTTTGMWAFIGLILFVAALVLLSFYIVLKTGLFGESTVPPVAYLIIGGGLVISGVIVTAISSLQAFVNRILDRIFG